MADPLHLLLMSNRDLRASVILAGRYLGRRKYDVRAQQIVKVLRQSLRAARLVARTATADRPKS